MSKTAKWLIAAGILVLLGSLIFAGGMTMLGWDFTKLSTQKLETNEYSVTQDYKNIKIVTDTARVEFLRAEETKVTCLEEENGKHEVSVRDDTLVIELHNTKKWYDYIGICFGTPKITVALPEGAYGSLAVETSTGNVTLSEKSSFETVQICLSTGSIDLRQIDTGDLSLSVSTGRITLTDGVCRGDVRVDVTTGEAVLTDLTCRNFSSAGNTGDLTLEHVVAEEALRIERSTGDITLQNSDAGEIFIRTDTGDVKGSLLTDKVFFTRTDTGSIRVPKSLKGGACEIETDTGDIKIEIAG